MQERLRGYLDIIKNKWDSLEKNQKIQLIAAIAIVILSIGVTIYMTTRTNWVDLTASNEDPLVVTSIKGILDSEGINNRYTDTGKLQIDEKDRGRAKILVSSSTSLNSQPFTFADALNAIGMSTTESQRKDMMQRVTATELEQSLRVFEGVDSATVKLGLPSSNNWFQQQDPVTASVILKTNKAISKEQAHTMARFVCSSITGLTMDNLVITNQRAETVYSPTDNDAGYAISDLYGIERQLNSDINLRLRGMYSPIYDDVLVACNIVINKDKTTSRSQEYEAPLEDGNMVDWEKNESQTVTDSSTANEPGTGTNNATTPAYNIGNDSPSKANIKNSEKQYLWNSIEKVTESGLGEILYDKSSVSVVFYKYVDYYEDQMTPAQLNNMSWNEFKLANRNETSLTVSADTAKAITTGTGISNITVQAFEKPLFHDAVVTPLNIREIVLFSLLALFILMLAFGLIKKTEPAEVIEIEPELSVEDLLVSTQLEEQKIEEAEKLQEIDFAKDSEYKKQIEKIVSEKPEAVVQLLRNWINEKEWE